MTPKAEGTWSTDDRAHRSRHRIWVKLVAGMTMTEIIAEVYRKATGENVVERPGPSDD